ncbi:MAG: alpha/beta hydrolase family protein [Deltaproteobacteria bacterium]|nr:alpha/beta hydrolase family protein [Deltaproteobacteria bacterium]
MPGTRSASLPAPRSTHWLDRAYAALSSRHKLFSEGWGDERVIESLASGRFFADEIAAIGPAFGPARREGSLEVRDGSCTSPLSRLPDATRTMHLRWLRASASSGPTTLSARATQPRRAALLLAGSREEGYGRRTSVFAPLAREGIDLFLLENPFYGLRRPPGQVGGNVRTVAEQMLLNLGMIEESRSLLAWMAQRHERITIAGYSMGGHMALCAGVLAGRDVGIAAMAAGSSPVPIYTRDLLSRSVDFEALARSRGTTIDDARARLAELFGRADATLLPPPRVPSRAVLVAIERDGYVSLAECERLHAHWPGSTLRRVPGGHVSAMFTQRAALRSAVRDTA